MRRVFKDEGRERLFKRDGSLVLKALDAAAVRRVEEFYLATCDNDFTGFRNTPELHDSEKKGDPASVVNPHQDWTIVDGAEYASANLWVPLCDTDAGNGAPGVFKGSHRLKRNIRGTNLFSNLALPDDYSRCLTFFHMKAGEALALTRRTIHASGANTSGKLRVIAAISVIPAEARPLHYVGDKLGSPRGLEFEVDDEFYHNYHLDRAAYANPAANYLSYTDGHPCRVVEYTPVVIDGHDIRRLYEPRAVTALRRIKDRLKAKTAFR